MQDTDNTISLSEHDKLITIAQAAEMLSVSRDTIRRMFKSGKLTHIKVAGTVSVRVKLSEVIAVMQSREK